MVFLLSMLSPSSAALFAYAVKFSWDYVVDMQPLREHYSVVESAITAHQKSVRS
jgi:hypothetical protein